MTVRLAEGGVAPELMIWMRMGGSRAKRFLNRFDINQDGLLGPGESSQLADALGPEAVGGVFLSLNQKRLQPLSASSKAQGVKGDVIEVAVLLTYGPHPLGEGRLTLGARPGRDRPGSHPHLGEIGVLAPLWLKTPKTRVRRLGARKITPKTPWSVRVTLEAPAGPGPSVAP